MTLHRKVVVPCVPDREEKYQKGSETNRQRTCYVRNGEGTRRKSKYVVVKGGQPGVESECVGTTWFRRIVQNDLYFENL